MIIVTGGAGMIGSNLIKGLNDLGRSDIIVVDNLKRGEKFVNLVDLNIADYLDKETFMANIVSANLARNLHHIEVVFHQGACSSTTEWDGQYMMRNNYQYSKDLLHHCQSRGIPFVYASSAAVYGNRTNNFIEDPAFEQPLNVYGYSKYLFDQYVRRLLPKARFPMCGLRYFNVYGPHESHKGGMASVAFHLNAQIRRHENPKLFAGSEHFQRDFITVEDVVAVNLWCWKNRVSGIFNCGTGQAESFQAVADAVIAYHQTGRIETIPFPEVLKDRYQTHTQADLTQLRSAGYDQAFTPVAEGVKAYMAWLNALKSLPLQVSG